MKSELEAKYNKFRESAGDVRAEASNPTDGPPSDAASSTSDETSPTKKSKSTRTLFSSVLKQRQVVPIGPAKVIEELDVYLTEATASMDCLEDPPNPESKTVTFRPLRYWKQNEHRFPFLARIAREVFRIPASSGSVERVFSTATDILTCKRARMKSDHFAMLLFIKRNARLVSYI